VIYTSLRLTSRTVFTRTLQLPAPMRDPKTLRTLILLDLESHPPDAPIDIVRVQVEPTPAKVLQWTLLERARAAPEQISTLTARLTALMGHGHVGSPVLVDTWRPGAFTMSDFGSREPGHQATRPPGHQESKIANIKSALRRFRFPIPTRVVVAEGRPIRIQIDRQGFSSGAIVQAAGPWRTSGEWWNTSGPGSNASVPSAALGSSVPSTAWDRDEWDVAMTDGTVYRLIVERGVGQWFLEGVID
jgi:protein ImuB